MMAICKYFLLSSVTLLLLPFVPSLLMLFRAFHHPPVHFPSVRSFELAKCLTKKLCPHQKAIVKQGDQGNSRMYFIKRGEVTVLKHLEVTEINRGQVQMTTKYLRLAYLKPKEYFGELALLCNAPRATSIYCNSNVELLVMSKIDFTRCACACGRRHSPRRRESACLPACSFALLQF
jgi:CRP-like cAMP-binding protein